MTLAIMCIYGGVFAGGAAQPNPEQLVTIYKNSGGGQGISVDISGDLTGDMTKKISDILKQRESVQKIRAMTLKVGDGECYVLELGFYGDGTATDNLERGAGRGAIVGELPALAGAVGGGIAGVALSVPFAPVLGPVEGAVGGASLAGGAAKAITSPLIAVTAAGGAAFGVTKNLVYGKYSTSNKVTITRYTGAEGDKKEKDLAITTDRAQKIAEIVKIVIACWKDFVMNEIQKQNAPAESGFFYGYDYAKNVAYKQTKKALGNTWSLEGTKRDLEKNFAKLLEDKGYQETVTTALDDFTKVDVPAGSVEVSG